MKIIDISFYTDNSNEKLAALISKHQPALAYANYLRKYADIQFIKHLQQDEAVIIDEIKYTGFKSNNNFWHIPVKTMEYIKNENPDVVIVQGLVFPLQLISLKKKLKKGCVILVQHHGETAYTRIKKLLQQRADKITDGYLFTSKGNAAAWIKNKIISDPNKCYELLEASTSFQKRDKIVAKEKLAITGDFNFLWVGRLNKGKDPCTVVNAFADFCKTNPAAKLYMIYQSDELLNEINSIIAANKVLHERIVLVGKLLPQELEKWYNAADFFVSGSHHEGSGYALLEAMACGCIPVVTNIPSFSKITGDGKYGILYETGNETSLKEAFTKLDTINKNSFSMEIVEYFKRELSFESIASNLYKICEKLLLTKSSTTR